MPRLIRKLLAAGVTLCSLLGSSAPRAAPHYVMHDVEVRLDQVAPAEASKVGDVDRLRVVYDQNAIDPQTHRVPLANFQHFIHGKYTPEHPDALVMPMNDAWLDLSRVPYRLHFHAAVTHGKPIIIDVDANATRLTIHPQSDPAAVLLSGLYRVDPRPITGPAAQRAATVPRDTHVPTRAP